MGPWFGSHARPNWASELLCNVITPTGKLTPPVNVAAIQNDCHFVDDILKFASSFENSIVFLWALFPVVQLMICQD